MLFFDLDSVVPTRKSRAEIDAVMRFHQEHGIQQLLIEGYADRSGTAEYNVDLSRRRAEAVRAIFIKAGIPEQNIKLLWWGEVRPLVPTKDGALEPQNRRVQICTGCWWKSNTERKP